jgi:hypothetical protein
MSTRAKKLKALALQGSARSGLAGGIECTLVISPDHLQQLDLERPAAGRPLKAEALLQFAAYAAAFNACHGIPQSLNALASMLENYADELPETRKLGRTKIREFSKAVWDCIQHLREDEAIERIEGRYWS